MRPHPINHQNNFIGGWFIDGGLCDRMILDFESHKEHHFQAHSARGYHYLPSFDMGVEVMTEYEQALTHVLHEYKLTYPYCYEGIDAFQLSHPYNIQKYEPGKYYSVWHCENNGRPQYRKRHLAFMTYLNTVTDGGETEFMYQECKISPQKGLTLIWPAHFTHTHKGIPSPSAEKYVTTGWYEFFDTDSFLEKQLKVTDEEFWASLNNMARNVT